MNTTHINRVIYWTNGIVLGLIIGIGVQVVFAWTAPTVAPPDGNTSPPINTSDTTQTKYGQLNVTALGDINDGNYWVDPNWGSRMNWVHGNGSRFLFMQDGDDPDNYFVDPNNGSIFNWIEGNGSRFGYMQDRDDPANYFVDPNNGSMFNWIEGNGSRFGYMQDRGDPDNYYLDPNGGSKVLNLEIDGDTVAEWPDDDNDIPTKKYVDAVGAVSCHTVSALGYNWSTAYCPDGYVMTGGGCDGNESYSSARPEGNGFYCRTIFDSSSLYAYARCCQ